ncbi:MAG: hypothetical protein HZB51_08365 [Chloroflexi bacterium]|nr:hypothetical protein [Chloroflexota bacterium]
MRILKETWNQQLRLVLHSSQIESWRLGYILLLSVWITSCAPTHNSTIWYFSNVWVNNSTENGEIHTIDPITRQIRTIIRVPSQAGISHAALSPDGTHIAYSSGVDFSSNAVWLAKSDGSNSEKFSDDYSNVDFFWLDNQRVVIFGSVPVNGADPI